MFNKETGRCFEEKGRGRKKKEEKKAQNARFEKQVGRNGFPWQVLLLH